MLYLIKKYKKSIYKLIWYIKNILFLDRACKDFVFMAIKYAIAVLTN